MHPRAHCERVPLLQLPLTLVIIPSHPQVSIHRSAKRFSHSEVTDDGWLELCDFLENVRPQCPLVDSEGVQTRYKQVVCGQNRHQGLSIPNDGSVTVRSMTYITYVENEWGGVDGNTNGEVFKGWESREDRVRYHRGPSSPRVREGEPTQRGGIPRRERT